MKRKLLDAGVDVIGPTDHGFVRSIYFFDPNGLRAELTCRTEGAAYLAKQEADAHRVLATWNARDGAAS